MWNFWCEIIPWTEEPESLQSMGSHRVPTQLKWFSPHIYGITASSWHCKRHHSFCLCLWDHPLRGSEPPCGVDSHGAWCSYSRGKQPPTNSRCLLANRVGELSQKQIFQPQARFQISITPADVLTALEAPSQNCLSCVSIPLLLLSELEWSSEKSPKCLYENPTKPQLGEEDGGAVEILS